MSTGKLTEKQQKIYDCILASGAAGASREEIYMACWTPEERALHTTKTGGGLVKVNVFRIKQQGYNVKSPGPGKQDPTCPRRYRIES